MRLAIPVADIKVLWTTSPIMISGVHSGCHYSSVTYLSLFNALFRLTISKYDDSHYWPFVRGIYRWLIDSPHQGPLKRFPYYGDVTILTVYSVCTYPQVYDSSVLSSLPHTDTCNPSVQPPPHRNLRSHTASPHNLSGTKITWIS